MSYYDQRSPTQQLDPRKSPALHLRVESPSRPPDWRWQKATLLRTDPKAARLLSIKIDVWTRNAAHLQKRLAGCVDTYDVLILRRKLPSLCEAYLISEEKESLVRWGLQARISIRRSTRT